MSPDIVVRLAQPVDLHEVKPLLSAARQEIIELRMALNDRVCTHCGGEGHRAGDCPWKKEARRI
jgi:hypothetical protein